MHLCCCNCCNRFKPILGGIFPHFLIPLISPRQASAVLLISHTFAIAQLLTTQLILAMTKLCPILNMMLISSYSPPTHQVSCPSLLPEVNDIPLPSISPLTVHVEGVAQLLTNIQTHKASGPDNLPARFLKEVAYEIAPVLTIVFQASLDQGHLPNIW